MTIIVFPNNTLLFRDSETKEPETAIFSYTEVKEMFGFEDERCGNPEAAERLYMDGLECVVFYNRLSSGIIDVRGSRGKSKSEVTKQRMRESRNNFVFNDRQRRAERRHKLLDGIAKQYELTKESFQ